MKAATIAIASPSPSSEPAAPSSAPCSRKTRWIWPRVAPIARRMPISRCFCTTLTTSTLAMPSTTTSSTTPRISVVLTRCASSAETSCALVCCQLSTRSGHCRASASASACAAQTSASETSMRAAPPGRSNRLCALRSGTYSMRRLSSVAPRSTSAVMRSVCVRVPLLTPMRSPTRTPRSSASVMPATASPGPSRACPATVRAFKPRIRSWRSSSMPVSVTARVASPRCASAAPPSVGETAATPARASSTRTSAGQSGSARSRCARTCASPKPGSPAARGSTGSTRSSGGSSTTWACAPSVRASVLRCRPSISTEM